jgi:hypothetical protein
MAPSAHARLGPSSAKRWMTCPGSIALSEGIPPITSKYAAEGTSAHDLGEQCLRLGTNPDEYIGDEIGGYVVTEDMAGHVALYVNHCREYMSPGWEWWIEEVVSLEALHPPESMFGTSDFFAYHAELQRLKVADMKFGQGVVVEIADNEQTLTYALGAALALGPRPIRDVELTIVQPRASHVNGPVRSVIVPYLDLIEFAGRLLAAARATQEPNAPLVAGEHCRFCPASGACPAQQARALQVAQVDFALEEVRPPSPAVVPLDVMAEWLPKMDILEDWIEACRKRVKSALLAGEEVPGWKLVPTRATRKWANEDEAAAALTAARVAEIYEPPSLKSVAQIEKLVGKKAFKALPIADQIVKTSTGIKLVPEADPTPALVFTAGAEFLALPAGDPSQNNKEEN